MSIVILTFYGLNQGDALPNFEAMEGWGGLACKGMTVSSHGLSCSLKGSNILNNLRSHPDTLSMVEYLWPSSINCWSQFTHQNSGFSFYHSINLHWQCSIFITLIQTPHPIAPTKLEQPVYLPWGLSLINRKLTAPVSLHNITIIVRPTLARSLRSPLGFKLCRPTRRSSNLS